MPIITLMTDFGLADSYVGVMKGVIAGIAPRATVIDVSHDIAPFQIAQARFLLAQSWPYSPKKTIHVAIVDPGVGSSRRGLLVQAAGHSFIGPDNGLFSDIVTLKGAKVRHLTQSKYWLKNVSVTFHGRDVFCPVAAHLATGISAARFGPAISDAIRVTGGENAQRTGRRLWTSEVVHQDRFGNLITGFRAADFPEFPTRRFCVRIGFKEVFGLTSNYSQGEAGEPVAIVGSSGHLEIAINQDSAARRLGCGLGSPVELEWL